MIIALTLTLLAAPQLRVEPERIAVGQELVVTVTHAGHAAKATAVAAQLPDGSERVVGATGADGRLTFVPELAGRHVFRAEVEGVAMLAPVEVTAARPRWLAAAVCVPLALALLWRALSARRAQPSTRST